MPRCEPATLELTKAALVELESFMWLVPEHNPDEPEAFEQAWCWVRGVPGLKTGPVMRQRCRVTGTITYWAATRETRADWLERPMKFRPDCVAPEGQWTRRIVLKSLVRG